MAKRLIAPPGLFLGGLYLRTATTSSTGSHVFLGDCCPPLARLIASMPPSAHRQISAIVKIVVGLVQCLATLRRFSHASRLKASPLSSLSRPCSVAVAKAVA